MQKIKLSVFGRMIGKRLTGAEINFILYISHFQDDSGRVPGVHYKDVCAGINISPQTFYEAMRGLREKGLIETEKNHYGDWDVRIAGNDFSYEGAFQEGYISTKHGMFHDPEFYGLKAGEKLLAMHLLKIAGAGNGRCRRGVDKLYQKFMALLGVTRRVIQGYLGSLRKFFSIGIKDHQYWITPLKRAYKDAPPTDMDLYAAHLAGTACRRNRIKAYTEQEFRDAAELVPQYAEQLKKASVRGFLEVAARCFLDAVCGSVKKENERIPSKYKWNRVLQPKFIHKLMRSQPEISQLLGQAAPAK